MNIKFRELVTYPLKSLWILSKNDANDMRIIKEIVHELARISIFHWNGKYLIKLEQDGFEQTFKINELDITDPDQIEDVLTDRFIASATARFRDMQHDLAEAMESIL